MWSLGVVLYELLTGKVPFDGDSLADVYAKICRGEFEIPKTRRPKLTRDCTDLIHRMICVDPEERITAKQALEHDWLKKHLAESRRLRSSM